MKRSQSIRYIAIFVVVQMISIQFSNAQTAGFFQDVSSMSIRMCFNEYQLTDPPFEIKNSGSSSRHAFLHKDSTQVITVRLYKHSPNKNTIENSKSDIPDKDYLIKPKYLREFNASFGGVTLESGLKKENGFTPIGSLMIVGKTGIIQMTFYNKENGRRKKMSKKELIKASYRFIGFLRK